MIIDPDFFDHWRTRMVVDALGGDEMAPMYIMRLWAHCQNRKGDTFTIPSAGIKALCKYMGDAATFEKALIDAEFLARDGDTVTVEGWAERNASLLAAWENGGKGGRPKKPMGNQNETHGKPNGNPEVTHGQPMANPGETDKSREDKNSSSLRSEEKPARAARMPTPDCPPDVDAQVWSDWLSLRKAKKAPVTYTVIESARKESAKASMSFEAFLRIWCRRGSQGLEAEWLKPHERGSPPRQPTAAQMAMAQACPTLVAPHMQQFAPVQATFVEVVDGDALRLG